MNTETETILLVEDCEDDVFFFQRTLRRAGLGYPLVIVPDGREAMAYLRGEGQTRFPSLCAVVMELVLPWQDGFELLKWIRAQPHLEGLPIIVLTGSIRKRDFERAEQLGATKVFLKTCNPDDLQEVAEYLKDVCFHQAPSFDSEPAAPCESPRVAHADASELLATLAARLK